LIEGLIVALPNDNRIGEDHFQKIRELMNNNEWILAADLCQESLSKTDGLGAHQELTFLTELSGECHSRAAFQKASREHFEKSMELGKEAFEEASRLYVGAHRLAESKRATSQAKIAQFWLSRSPVDRKLLSEEIVRSVEEARRSFELNGKTAESEELMMKLLAFFREFINLSTDSRYLENLFRDMVELGKQTIEISGRVTAAENIVEAVSAYVWAIAVEGQIILSPSDFRSLEQKAKTIQQDLTMISEGLNAPRAASLAAECMGHIHFNLEGDPRSAMDDYERSLTLAKKAEDTLQIGRIQWLISQTAQWLGYGEVDADEQRLYFEKGLHLSSDAISNLEVAFQTNELSAAFTIRSQCLTGLARLQKGIPQRKDLLNRAVIASKKALAFESGTWGWSRGAHSLSVALHSLSKIENLRLGLSCFARPYTLGNRLSKLTIASFLDFGTRFRRTTNLRFSRRRFRL